MSERNGIFAGDNPFEIARRWLGEAEERAKRSQCDCPVDGGRRWIAECSDGSAKGHR